MIASEPVLVGAYDYRTVALSVVIAVAASFAAFDLAGRVTAARGRSRYAWLLGGANALGIGTWSMHYVGMLAFRLPVPVSYHWPTALLSLLPGLLASGLALGVVSRPTMGAPRAWIASLFMGGGIATLHYTAMDSMRLRAMCHYSPPLVTLSVLLAIAVSWLSLWLMFLLRDDALRPAWRRIGSALLMGAAIAGMHYTGMASVSYTPTPALPDLSHSVGVSYLGAAGITVVSLMVLIVAMLGSLADRLQRQQAQLRALSTQLRSVREDEAGRIAREIHDELGQKLTGLKMDLLWTERKLGELEGSPAINPILDRVVAATELVENITGSVQQIASDLRPDVLDKLGIGPALQYEARRFQERTTIPCEVRLPSTYPVQSCERSIALFRIFQECLTNVARHAHATRVEAELRPEDGWLILSVADDGRGITNAELTSGQSLGLLGMKERAALLGGEIRFHHRPGGGTTVTVRLPLKDPNKAPSVCRPPEAD
jgi:NO-binding membrane sensor protein with MHYT domain